MFTKLMKNMDMAFCGFSDKIKSNHYKEKDESGLQYQPCVLLLQKPKVKLNSMGVKTGFIYASTGCSVVLY